MHNAFEKALYADGGKSLGDDVVEMKRRQDLENDVQEKEATTTGWTRGTAERFLQLDFIPDYDLPDVRKLACGPYVLGLAARFFKHAKNVIYRYHKNFQITGNVSRHSKNDENVSGLYIIGFLLMIH